MFYGYGPEGAMLPGPARNGKFAQIGEQDKKMNKKQDSQFDERPETPPRSYPAPQAEQRRFYRPEEMVDEKRPIFTDWASI